MKSGNKQFKQNHKFALIVLHHLIAVMQLKTESKYLDDFQKHRTGNENFQRLWNWWYGTIHSDELVGKLYFSCNIQIMLYYS